MKKINLSALFLAAVLFGACNSTTTEQAQSLPGDTMAFPAANTDVQQTPETATGATQVSADQSVPTTPAENPNANLKGMNPAHGQPGHRCDIEVGAPLNSPPGNKVDPVITQSAPAGSPTMQSPTMQSPTIQSTPINVQPSIAPTTTAPGMNPPHGQPGHDCAIAVGAPLKK